MNRLIHPNVLVATLVAAAILAGCAGLPRDLAAEGSVATERADSPLARLGRVRVSVTDSMLEVSGTLARHDGLRGPIPGHLDVEAIDERGSSLASATTGYHRIGVKSRRAEFSEILAVDPRTVRKVRITHHELSRESC